jgi:hypothetical protein
LKRHLILKDIQASFGFFQIFMILPEARLAPDAACELLALLAPAIAIRSGAE